MTGATLAQLLNFISFPIIASWYGPNEFGNYATFAFYVAILPLLMTLRMEMAVMQDPDEHERNTLLLISFLNSLILFAICLVIAAIASDESRIQIILIGVGAFIASLQNVNISLLNISERYWVLSLSRLLFPILFLLTTWSLKDSNILFPLALAHAISTLLVVILLFKMSIYRIKINNFIYIRPVIRKYIHYIKYDLPSASINACALLLPAYLIGVLFNEESAGLYFLAFKLILSPLGAITLAVGYVYRREAVKEYNSNGSFIHSTKTSFKILLVIAILMLISFYSFGEYFFVLAFGDEWVKALPLISILMPMFAFKLLASPLSFSFYIVDKLKLDLYGQSIFVLLTAVSIFVGYINEDFIFSVLLVSISSILVYVGYAILSIYFSRGNVN